MERLKGLLRQKEFHILLFFLSLFLFGWPVVEFSDVARLEAMFVYLFAAWSVVILLLYLVGRSLDESDESEQGDKGKP